VGIEERLQRLEAANPDLCEQRPCQGPVAMTQKRLMPDGSVEVSGEPHRRSAMPAPSATTQKPPYATSRCCTVFPQGETSGKLRTSKAAPATKAQRSSMLCMTTHHSLGYSPHLLVAGVIYPTLAEVGDVRARYDTIRGLIDRLATPPAAVRAAVGIKETLESLRYVQYPTPGVVRVCTI
jgi:hypothetical protein